MRGIGKILMIFIILCGGLNLLVSCEKVKSYKRVDDTFIQSPAKVDVLLYRFDDDYIAAVKDSLEKIQAENKEKVEFTFHDGRGDQGIQDQTLNKVLREGTDLLMLNLVDVSVAQRVINRIKETNIPVILFNREPNIPEQPIKTYSRALFIGTDAREAGILQGRIIIDEWNNNRRLMDKNNDGVLQYIMLKGEPDNLEAIGRTRYSISTIEGAGIRTEELASRVGNWDRETARSATEALFFRFGNRIEAIISNNDAMAIGAIEALQARGFNQGDPLRTIAVVGVDATDEAQELIAKGFMLGTVLQDDYQMAEALYKVGMNVVSGRSPLEGTNYLFDETGVSIRLPYQEYTKNHQSAD